jgi:hypothetical protein
MMRCVVGTLLVPGVLGDASDEAEEELEDLNIGGFFGRVLDLSFPFE